MSSRVGKYKFILLIAVFFAFFRESVCFAQGDCSWIEIEKKRTASEITSVNLPVPATFNNYGQLYSDFSVGGNKYRVSQDWRFNGSYSSSSPSTCSGESFPPHGAGSWASNIAVYPTSPTYFGLSEEQWSEIYPYHPWDDATLGTYAATDNRKICGNDGYGRVIRVGTPLDHDIIVSKWVCDADLNANLGPSDTCPTNP